MENFFDKDIIKEANRNNYFRKVLETRLNAQLVVMSLLPKEDIGMEVHKKYDQILVNVSGNGKCVLSGKTLPFKQNSLVYVPKGTWHNFINTGNKRLKLFTIYAPANHPPKTLHKTKKDAIKAEKNEKD